MARGILTNCGAICQTYLSCLAEPSKLHTPIQHDAKWFKHRSNQFQKPIHHENAVESGSILFKIRAMNEQTDVVEIFMASEAPARPKSKLLPHRDAIERLRTEGYTLHQICKFLSTQGVSADPSLLSKFLRAAANSAAPPQNPPAAKSPRTLARNHQNDERPVATPAGSQPASPSKSVEDLMRENPELTQKQAEEKFVDQFAPKVTNPLISKFGRGAAN